MSHPTITPRRFQPARVSQQDEPIEREAKACRIAASCLSCHQVQWKCARCGDMVCSRHNAMLPHNLAYHGWPAALRTAMPRALCSPCNAAMHPAILPVPDNLWRTEMDFRASKDPALVLEWWARAARIDAAMIEGGRNSASHEELYLEEIRAWGRAKGLLS